MAAPPGGWPPRPVSRRALRLLGSPALLLPLALLAACGSETEDVKETRILTIEEASASVEGTWKRDCTATDTGVQQLVLQFSGSATLFSTQDWDAPADECSGTPTAVEEVTGTSNVQAEPKEVTWIGDVSPEGLPDDLLASKILLDLDKAIGKTTEWNLIVVLDGEASPALLYISTSEDDDVTLDESGYPDELSTDPYAKD